MTHESVSRLTDSDLTRALIAGVARDRQNTAVLIAHLAEIDARRLYAKVGYPSMEVFCVAQYHLDEDEATVRVQAARAARRFPAIFEAVADGRLELETVVLLVPYLTEESAGELLAAAASKGETEIRRLLAERLPAA